MRVIQEQDKSVKRITNWIRIKYARDLTAREKRDLKGGLYKLQEDGTLMRKNISGSVWAFVVPNIQLEEVQKINETTNPSNMRMPAVGHLNNEDILGPDGIDDFQEEDLEDLF